VVIGQKVKAQPAETSRKPKEALIIDLSDDKEVCIPIYDSNILLPLLF
jgi:hypothetical protein